MRVALKQTRLGLLNSTTRIPFKYGKAVLTKCPQAVMQSTVEVAGNVHHGYSGDCLPPSWFDKSPGKDFAAQIDDMLAVIKLAEKDFAEELASPCELFAGWLIAYERIHSRCAEWGLPPLLASFGISMVERAMIDAICRATGLAFHQAAKENLFGIAASVVHASLRGTTPAGWLPDKPSDSMWVRHTVGLADPLTAADVPDDERLVDGFPQTLEEYITRTGLRYFKIKVSNRLEEDLARLETIATLIESHRGDDYHVTLDGNEQYKAADEFDALIGSLRSRERLQTLWKNTLVIEQPLERGVALDAEHTKGIAALSKEKPVIIDESDGRLESFATAAELGYRGVSSKCCKGPIKSLLNAGLVWQMNDRGARRDFVMTGEDLCTVGVVPVQSDLCLVATIGLEHVERNGHHFHPGLSYLPAEQQQAALAAHGDFYHQVNGVTAPRLADGRFQIASLHCPGFGFAALPDMDAMTPADEWEFSSLDLK